ETAAGLSRRHLRINCLQSHLIIECAKYKLANGNFPAMGEEWPDAKIGVYALDGIRIDCAVRPGCEAAEVDALADKLDSDVTISLLRSSDCLGAKRPQIGRDFVGEHFF